MFLVVFFFDREISHPSLDTSHKTFTLLVKTGIRKHYSKEVINYCNRVLRCNICFLNRFLLFNVTELVSLGYLSMTK